MADYIQAIRAKVAHMPIILNAAAGAIVKDKQQILLQERTDTHNWSLPGGYMEYGETYEQNVLREVAEDSGFQVKIIAPIGLFDQGFTTYPNGDQCQVISRLFLVEPIGGDMIVSPTDETLSLKYFDFDNLPPLLNPQTKDMIIATQKFVQS
ncbi:MAG: NUDIX hydrolase [Lactobacillus sp.]|nr:NUDIX hydrolase [Lactobacillus sp.]